MIFSHPDAVLGRASCLSLRSVAPIFKNATIGIAGNDKGVVPQRLEKFKGKLNKSTHRLPGINAGACRG
jgi:hypothetical protein